MGPNSSWSAASADSFLAFATSRVFATASRELEYGADTVRDRLSLVGLRISAAIDVRRRCGTRVLVVRITTRRHTRVGLCLTERSETSKEGFVTDAAAHNPSDTKVILVNNLEIIVSNYNNLCQP